jgi:hypothetical protein
MRVRATLCILALAALLGACEQGAGDVCQVNSDCESPLLCNASTGQCQRPGTGGVADAAAPGDAAIPIDADILPDAPPPDAAPPDAAAPDAGEPDAAVDAAPPDAAAAASF